MQWQREKGKPMQRSQLTLGQVHGTCQGAILKLTHSDTAGVVNNRTSFWKLYLNIYIIMT